MDSDVDELARFREEWKNEVAQRSNITRSAKSQDESALLPSSRSGQDTNDPTGDKRSYREPIRVQRDTPSRALTNHAAKLPRVLASAVETYGTAVAYERAGDLDDALRLYRNAFRIDANVDKAYRREEKRLEALAAQNHHHAREERLETDKLPAKAAPLTKTVVRAKQLVSKYSDAQLLIKLISTFPSDLDFEPLHETSLAPFRLIPEEIIILIIKALGPHSIERFALLNRKARILSLDSSVWRDLVHRTYIPPQVPEDLNIDSLAREYSLDYRQLYVEYPRLRIDGVYIAVCHYVRPGLNSDNVWVRVSHLITYHRYLRFLPDGTVLSLLANEDVEPQTIIPTLQPSLRMKGLFIGNWSLEGTTCYIRDLKDPTGCNSRYTFQMTLTLKSKPLGRWNKLDLDEYDSVNKEDGETIPLGLKHERPFWFSKVRSYAEY